jgi:hypothetical protein
VNEDFENLLKLFDYALSSDNPAVKNALKNLLLVVSIVEPQEEDPNKGPLHDLKKEIQDLRMQVSVLRSELAVLRQAPNTTYPSYPAYPPTYTAYPGTGTPWIPGGGITSSSTSTTSTSSVMNEVQLKKLLEGRLRIFNYKPELDSLDDN